MLPLPIFLQRQQRPGHIVCPQPGAVDGLGEGIAVAPHLHQDGTRQQLLVIAAVAQDDGPGQAGIAPHQVALEEDVESPPHLRWSR